MTYSKYKNANDKCKSLIKDYIKPTSLVNPQKESPHSTTRIENHIMEALSMVECKCGITKDVILILMRKTWGFKHLTWTIKVREIMEHLPPNTEERTVHNAIKEAIDHKVVVVVEEKGRPTTFGINKHYDLWIYDKELKGLYTYIPKPPQNDTKPSVSSETGNTGATDCSGIVDDMGNNKESE